MIFKIFVNIETNIDLRIWVANPNPRQKLLIWGSYVF